MGLCVLIILLSLLYEAFFIFMFIYIGHIAVQNVGSAVAKLCCPYSSGQLTVWIRGTG